MTHPLTPSQTVGPFFHDCLLRSDAVTRGDAPGRRIRIVGTVYDGAGDGVPDAVIEAWQGSTFSRVGTEVGGEYAFSTVDPSVVDASQGTDAPHIDVVVFARGLLNQLVTRIYFPDEPANSRDPVLQLVPAARRATLMAQRDTSIAGDASTYRFDIVLQGGMETVFFQAR